MKALRVSVLLFFLLYLTEVASAQLLVGVEGGVNYSWTSFGEKDQKDLYKVEPVPGFNVGGHVAFRVRKRFFLHTSFLYSTKGKIIKGKEETLYNEAHYKYVELPIAYTVDFKGKLGKSKEFKYFIGVGPIISYWLSGKGTIENNDTHEFNSLGNAVIDYTIIFDRDPYTAGETEMVIEKPNRTQLGLNFVAGIVVEPRPSQVFMLTLRYELGHTYLSRESDGHFGITYYEEPLKIRNQGLRVSLAYLLDTRVDQRKKGKSTIKRNKH